MNPGLPWFTPQAVEFLQDFLLQTDAGLEFGSGRSTLWFARRVQHLTSVEHNPEWSARVTTSLSKQKITNVDLIHQPRLQGPSPDVFNSGYVLVTAKFMKESLDFVSIDGIYRAECTIRSIPLLKPGAILIIDNVNKYLPGSSMAPNSRTFAEGPDGPVWSEIWKVLHTWRYYWTSNGVSDTAIFFKPAINNPGGNI